MLVRRSGGAVKFIALTMMFEEALFCSLVVSLSSGQFVSFSVVVSVKAVLTRRG